MSVFSEFHGLNALSSALFLSIICIVAVPFLIIREMFKPIDQRKAPAGKRWRLPPGPLGIPIFGNLLQFRKARHDSAQLFQWVSIHFLTEKNGLMPCQLSSVSQYGKITTLRLGSKTWVLLNSDRVISEIIAKRGAITSERPFLPIATGSSAATNAPYYAEPRNGPRVDTPCTTS